MSAPLEYGKMYSSRAGAAILGFAHPRLIDALRDSTLTINGATQLCKLTPTEQLEQFVRRIEERETCQVIRRAITRPRKQKTSPNVCAVLNALQQHEARQPGSVSVQVGRLQHTIVLVGQYLTLAHVEDYLARGLIHVVYESWYFPNRELLLPELTNAVNLYIKFRNALEQLKRLVDVKFDPATWISTTSTIVEGGIDLTMADVDDYLIGSG